MKEFLYVKENTVLTYCRILVYWALKFQLFLWTMPLGFIKTIDPFFPDVSTFQWLVVWLLYLTTTRSDISFATQQISQHMANPTQAHFWATTRILKYLKGCPILGLLFCRDSPIQLLGFDNADWGGLDSKKVSNRILLLHWTISYLLENKKANCNILVFFWSWI